MSENTLYRKYRPLRFADLIGQDHVARTLLNEISGKQLAHAYLFSGPRGVGKTTTARLLARAANCQHPKQGEPDNSCPACTAILEGKTLDIMEIDAASYTGVDNIREVIEHSRFTPSQLTYKVFIVDEVHMLSTAAFNALLKTLEEPPAHALFILATTELHKVPETIISRCQRFDFHRLGDADLATRLRTIAKAEKRSVEDNVVERIVRLADGSSRDAEGMLGQLFAMNDRTITQADADVVLPRSNQAAVAELASAILTNKQAEALQCIAAQLDEGVDLELFRTDLIRFLRDCLLYQLLPPAQRPAVPNATGEMLASIRPDGLVAALSSCLDAGRYVSVSPLPQLPLELAVLQVTTTAQTITSQRTPTASHEQPSPTKEPRPKAGKNDGVWPTIAQVVRAAAPALSVSLQMVVLQELTPTNLKLATPFALHAERLLQPTTIGLIQNAAAEVLGHPVLVQVTHDPTVSLDVPAAVPHNTPAAPTTQPSQAANPDQIWEQIVNAAGN